MHLTAIVAPVHIQPMIDAQTYLQILLQGSMNSGFSTSDQLTDLIQREREFVISLGRNLTLDRQTAVTIVTQDPRFQGWFKSMKSEVLIVSGMDMALPQNEAVSPLSYACALLSRTLSQQQFAYPLTFYCGLHMDPDDPISGAGGLLRSLIGQLILTIPSCFNPGDLNPAEVNGIQMQDLVVLCGVFEKLLQGLGAGVVFCIIDGIAWFESEARVRATHLVMQFLNSLVQAVKMSGTGLIFKVLVTSHVRSEHSRFWFPRGVEMTMPPTQHILMGGQGQNNTEVFLPAMLGQLG